MSDVNRTRPSDATRDEERREATMHATADEAPTPEQEQAAERATSHPEAADVAKAQYERGADHPGEGRIG